YAPDMGWDTLNLITTIGSFVLALGVLLFIVNVLKSRRSGMPAGANPWDGATLEWSVPSPPPAYNFAVIPTVASRHPLWESRVGTSGARSSIEQGMLLGSGKETLGTSALYAFPDMVLEMPRDTSAPFLLAVGATVLFVGLLLRQNVVAIIGAATVALATLVW